MILKLTKKNNISVEGNDRADKTIVFAHGFGTDQTTWATVKAAFGDNYRMLLFDNVGGGNADPEAFSPIKYNSLASYAEDLLAIIEAFSLKDIIVVAHSVSSMITLLAANKSPEYFSKLVFIGASPRYLNDEAYTGGFTQDVLDSMYENMKTNYYAWASGFSTAAMGNPEKPALGARFAHTLSAIRPDIALSVAKVIFQSDLRKELNKLHTPTLLIQADKDIAVPFEVGEYLKNNIKGSKLIRVDAEGHFPHISAPEEIISAIKAFI